MTLVLVVDDEEAFLQITQIVLKRAGYYVTTACNGFESLRAIEEQLPDLVILDEMMPGMSGSEVCQRIKTRPDWQHIPVIMHTASVRLKNPELVKDIQADAVMFKPTMPPELVATVARVLQARV
jgi:CheY-like chemotaxis protein